MKTRLCSFIVACLLAAGMAQAADITLSSLNTGSYWWQRSTWMGGSDTQTGFSYGDETGLLSAQSNYQYYGGADRYFLRNDAYLQIDLSALEGQPVTSAVLHIYVAQNNMLAETFFKHLTTQSVLATGDAAQQLAGDDNVVSSLLLSVGWNAIDITSYILADMASEYNFSAFSIPQFAQEQDQNRIISFYGGSTTVEIEDASAAPYLAVVIPEAGSSVLLLGATAFALGLRRRRL